MPSRIKVAWMREWASALGLGDPKIAKSFWRACIRWTLGFWAFAFLFLTIRSIVGGHGKLLLQAALRIPMIMIGLVICAALFLLLIAIERVSRPIKLALIAGAAVIATLVFSASAHVVYYVLPGLWDPPEPLAPAVARYAIQFIWIFPAWMLIFYYVRHRTLASAEPGAQQFARELWARHLDRQVRIPVGEIQWIESEGDYARVHMEGRSHLIRSTMHRLEASLDPEAFVRIHRRVIVARDAVASIRRRRDGGLTAQLETGVQLPVGRNYAARLKAPGPPQARQFSYED